MPLVNALAGLAQPVAVAAPSARPVRGALFSNQSEGSTRSTSAPGVNVNLPAPGGGRALVVATLAEGNDATAPAISPPTIDGLSPFVMVAAAAYLQQRAAIWYARDADLPQSGGIKALLCGASVPVAWNMAARVLNDAYQGIPWLGGRAGVGPTTSIQCAVPGVPPDCLVFEAIGSSSSYVDPIHLLPQSGQEKVYERSTGASQGGVGERFTSVTGDIAPAWNVHNSVGRLVQAAIAIPGQGYAGGVGGRPDLSTLASTIGATKTTTAAYTVPDIGVRSGRVLVGFHGVHNPLAGVTSATMDGLPMIKLVERRVENNVPDWTRWSTFFLSPIPVCRGQAVTIVATHDQATVVGQGSIVRAMTLVGASPLGIAVASDAGPDEAEISGGITVTASGTLIVSSLSREGYERNDPSPVGGLALFGPVVNTNALWNGAHAIGTMTGGPAGTVHPGVGWAWTGELLDGAQVLASFQSDGT